MFPIRLLIFFLMMLLGSRAYAESTSLPNSTSEQVHDNTNNGKKFPITISFDNQIIPLFHSQHVGTDLALSIMNGLAFTSDRFGWHNSIIGTLANTLLSYYIALLNHEFTGHGLKGQEFGARIEKIHIGFLHGWARNDLRSITIQKHDIFDISGNQANTVLADKITNQLLQHRQAISPVVAATYIISAYNQMYAIIWDSKPKKNLSDMLNHVEKMHMLYGRDSLTISKMEPLNYLHLLNPMLFASLYSIIARRDVRVPTYRLGILPGLGETGIMPLVRLILTPYNVLEKRLILYIDAAYSPIKIEFGFGKELKSNNPVKKDDFSWRNPYGRFTEKGNTNFKKSYTYYGALEVGHLLSIGSVKMGVTLSAWRQPELFVEHPINAKLKNGAMALVNLTYAINKRFNIAATMGYKSQGFVIGRPARECALIGLTGEWIL